MAAPEAPRRLLLPELLLLVLFAVLVIVAVAVTPELRDAILGASPQAATDAGAQPAPSPPE